MATDNGAASTASAEPPPIQQKTADELIAEMKKVPLFMTSMDDMDEDNDMIQALKAIAYEGTRAEIADNFRVQGNECVKAKQWMNAREFYTKALVALKGPKVPQPGTEGTSNEKVVEIEEEAEAKKENDAAEACYANRALCNLEMKNYGSCNKDCAGALKLNPRNVKAWYRAASACLALDKMPEALDACQSGLKFDPASTALQTLLTRIQKRRDHLHELEDGRRKREKREANERATLRLAIRERNIIARETSKAPDMEDAKVQLSDPSDARSLLSLPVIFLYPLHAQSDFVKAFAETETISQHLEYILPPPWDQTQEYNPAAVECYMETSIGGLIKAGKNLSLSKLLGTGKVEVVDGLVSINVVAKSTASQWIEDFKKRRGKQ
ncbi:HSP70/90 co-chaperone [Recurvomyces mirabilis]|nr:HSP70/90 co-chaperone [Recurvomyces mirabilis]